MLLKRDKVHGSEKRAVFHQWKRRIADCANLHHEFVEWEPFFRPQIVRNIWFERGSNGTNMGILEPRPYGINRIRYVNVRGEPAYEILERLSRFRSRISV